MDPLEAALPQFEGWLTIEKLGEGGMCSVYRARADDGTERAVKVLMDATSVSIRRFVDEATLLQRIDHPNVVRVHALAKDDRPPWLVMDLLAGRDLDETMRLEGPMDPERAARMFADLASGLACVHEAGIRHRDIKPANIRLGTDGIPRLIDFGIARDASSTRRTRQGFVVGTASYLPPEIFSDEDRGDNIQDTETADVYALGQTLCEALTGVPIHDSREGTAAGLLVRVMRDKLEREYLDPRDMGAKIPEDLALLVRRATMREPEVRTQTAKWLEEELRAWLQNRDAHAMVAPVTRVDLSSLEVPLHAPKSLPPAPKSLPNVGGAPASSVAPTSRGAGGPPSLQPGPGRRIPSPTPAPAPSRSGGSGFLAMAGVGAMGMAGITLLVIGLLALLVAGIAALFAFRPPPAPSPAELSAQVQAGIAELQPTLVACHKGSGDLRATVTVSGGRAQHVAIADSSVDRRSDRCVERALLAATYPQTPSPVTVDVPVQFR